MDEKDPSRLFKDVPDDDYKLAVDTLLALREKYPTYRDDQLLMYTLARLLPSRKPRKGRLVIDVVF